MANCDDGQVKFKGGVIRMTHEERIRSRRFPEPTTEEPTLEELEEMLFDSIVEATDGCMVEPDGICKHGHPSWLLRLGLL